MQKQIRNLVIGIASFIIFIIAAQIVMMQATRNIAFDYDVFKTQLNLYIESDESYYSVQSELLEYIEMVESHENPETINNSIYDILPEVSVNISYVSLNDEELRAAAEEVLEFGRSYFESEDVKLLSTVYAMEERVSLFLGEPRSYLYFALTADEEQMVAVKLVPTENELSITPLWDKSRASDDEFVIQETNRNLFIYTNQVF